MKSSLIALLTILVLALIQAVTRLENYHYANQIGLCSEYNIKDPHSVLIGKHAFTQSKHEIVGCSIYMQHLRTDGNQLSIKINLTRFTLLAVILSLSSCGMNYYIQSKGSCPTQGVSPLAGNCPTPEEMKQSKATAQ